MLLTQLRRYLSLLLHFIDIALWYTHTAAIHCFLEYVLWKHHFLVCVDFFRFSFSVFKLSNTVSLLGWLQSMIELSRTQDEEVGDGTTSVIILGMFFARIFFSLFIYVCVWERDCVWYIFNNQLSSSAIFNVVLFRNSSFIWSETGKVILPQRSNNTLTLFHLVGLATDQLVP